MGVYGVVIVTDKLKSDVIWISIHKIHSSHSAYHSFCHGFYPQRKPILFEIMGMLVEWLNYRNDPGAYPQVCVLSVKDNYSLTLITDQRIQT